MLEMIRGCKVPQAEQLTEQYEREEYGLTANVNASKIERVFQHFIGMQQGKLFFILELPTSEQDECRLRTSDTVPLHKDIYYIDGLNAEQASSILIRHGELLIHDGLCQFGFGAHDGLAELMLWKYNVMTLWTKETERYKDFFEAHDIFRADHCVTAWNTFTPEAPGESNSIEIEGKSVFDLPQELADYGIYFAERREDK